ncbi:hypothetical protein HYQ45_013699 [Verticillium longisporum]|uniref:DUF6594 domain-containing protein n=1 Tax=Verticillium longisporum TaxID=100787 RepID=A0A8I2ZDT7_VERLO|nr:hypothetical protein HYQ45_013699 [Verticillium longisporum]
MSTADVAAHDNYDTMYPGQLIRLSMAGLGMTGVYHHNIGSAVTGYPRLARYMATAENLSVFRQFRYLQTRIMLQLQDELRELETLLYRLDERDREFPGMLRSREYCDKRSQTRKMLLHRTRRKWMDYGKTNDVRSLKNASRYQLGYLSSFFRPRPPIDGNENFLVADGDLKSVRPDGDGVWLDEVLLYLMIRYECRPLRWLFGSKISQINDDQRQDTRQHTRNEKPASARALSSTEHVEQQRGQRTSRSSQRSPRHTLYDKDRIHAFTMVILIGLVLCFLAGPLYPLYSWVQGEVTPGRMGMIMGLQCVCTLLFGMVLAIFTNAKRHEIFTASAT